MTLTFRLTQNDYLQHQLFVASKSAVIKAQRLKTRFMGSGYLMLLSYLFYTSNDLILTYTFLILAIYQLVLSPLLARQRLKNYYSRSVSAEYKTRFGQETNIRFAEETIEVTDITGEYKIYLNQLESVTETGNCFFPKLKFGTYFIFPKSQMQDINNTRAYLKELCEKLKVPFVAEEQWKWK